MNAVKYYRVRSFRKCLKFNIQYEKKIEGMGSTFTRVKPPFNLIVEAKGIGFR